MGSQGTRLDRLVSLLDIGTSPSIRATAASQLGQIAALRVRGNSTTAVGDAPSAQREGEAAAVYHGVEGEWNEVLALLARVAPLLLSKNWETRTAAAQALSSICESAGVWDPDVPGAPTHAPVKREDEALKHEPDADACPDDASAARDFLRIADFSLVQTLAHGTKLLSTAGKEYEAPELLSRERLQSAKKDVLGRLGLGFGTDIDVGVDMDAELGGQKPATEAKPEPEPAPPAEPDRPLSARERNQLKRKRKNEAKGQTRAPHAAEPEKRAKHDEAPKPAFAAASLQVRRGEWPFRALAELLSVELFNPTWEARHGAALGLRELFRVQGSGGGKCVGAGAEANGAAHAVWCEDLAVRLLCVFALDRLGDFVFDHVVAPVRETASQTLAQLLPHMTPELVRATHGVLLEMVRQDTVRAAGLVAGESRRPYVWEVRHAGLLGIKYEVAMRVDVLGSADGAQMLSDVMDVALLGLRDDDDDVRAVSAATLLPITGHMAERLDRVPALLEQLWACIGDARDDLSSSAGGVMDLLAALISQPAIAAQLHVRGDGALATLLPRLFRFFRHTITSVRLAVLNAMQAFLGAPALPCDWVDDRLVRLLFQNMLVEERLPIREATARVWTLVLAELAAHPARMAACAVHVPTLFRLVMTPIGTPIDTRLFFDAGAKTEHDIDRSILSQDLLLVGVDTVIRGRLGAASALGEIIARSDAVDAPCELLDGYLGSASAMQKCLAAVVAQRWAELLPDPASFLATHARVADVHARLLRLLDAEPVAYAELGVLLLRLQHDCQALLSLCVRDAGVDKAALPPVPQPCTLEAARELCGSTCDRLVPVDAPRSVADQRAKIVASIERYESTKEMEDVLVLAAVATAVVAWAVLPEKLNPVIRSMMNSVKYEENADLQARSAAAIARFMALCLRPGARANPTGKIVKNLCAFACQDTSHTALYAEHKHVRVGILSRALDEPKKPRRGVPDEGLTPERLIRRGADAALQHICREFGERVYDAVPALYECSAERVLRACAVDAVPLGDEAGQGVLDGCTVLETIVPSLAAPVLARLEPVLVALVRLVQSDAAVLRCAAARCFSSLAGSMTDKAMHVLVEQVVPLLGDTAHLVHRQGAIETISCTVLASDERLLPYVLFLVVPVLGRMSDSDADVRLLATNTFAELVKLVPLIQGLPDPPGFPPALLARREQEQAFLAQLLDGSKVQPYELPVQMRVALRPYQHEGVSWMAFLARYQLHGILCDDMGLGKTLQSITLLSCKHHERDVRWRESQAPDARPIPSLIVCPPTLTGHWVHEIEQYSPNLRAILYAGQPAERARLQTQIASYDAVVMSYDVVRNDIAALAPLHWHYCILDEGHVICSAKTKTTRAVKQIHAEHRLILSGTPIQNHVLELWSLFDFLMPGFLGTDHAFHERFARPVLACRTGKPSAADKEAATLALEALHKQIVPFLLRRLKEDVLDDLPPKIIQDVECELSDVQKEMYDEYVRSKKGDDADDETSDEPKQHIFQSLQYLRKLANHPSLVLNPAVPAERKRLETVNAQRGTLTGLAQAPKLQALRQLLLDCGIGVDAPSTDLGLLGSVTATSVSQHRVLVFCQMKQMLDVIENDLLRALMPSVTYLRLDGSVSADRRHNIVQTFNADPSIDVLLLTTAVGGLGLTLTGADTVIFVEHDWNPMKDLQAMDRAHRLGQKKVVNVYRLITRNTLEAKIMGLQQFKMNIANSVVTQQNKSLENMDTDRILDMFGPADAQPQSHEKPIKGTSQKALLANLEQMPEVEEAEYASMANWRP